LTSPMTTEKECLGFGETVALMAILISLTALAIDIMLPALPKISEELRTRHANDAQLVIPALIFGLSLGQIFYGPFSDSTGRKPMLIVGIVIFIGGCVLSLLSTTFPVMLSGRVLQGIGLAGPRSMVVALVRDRYSGRTMAKMMSSIMAVFILIPTIAPAIGQGILAVAGWRFIFATLLIQAIIALIWFAIRQPETLPADHRFPFSPRQVGKALAEICRNRHALGYTVVAGCILGAFIGYLNCAQQIFQVTYRLGDRFPLVFGILALSIGCASLLNARIVMRYGMLQLTRWAMKILCGSASALLLCFFSMAGHPPLWLLISGLLLTLFCFGILFGNLNAIAMTPLGHIAGTGAAAVGSLSTFIAVPLAIGIGRGYDGTVLPLFAGFSILSLVSLIIIAWVGKGETLTDQDRTVR
jgi:MFS transporter, DHA1 family, multidrug resistance protein